MLCFFVAVKEDIVMFIRMQALVLWFAILLLAQGCYLKRNAPVKPITSQTPVPSAYPLSTQQKMQAVHHWGVLAEDTANIIDLKLKGAFPDNQNPIYVAPAGITPFDKAFHELLITRLVEKGLVVSNNYKNPLVLSFDTQVVAHKRFLNVETGAYTAELPEKEVMVTLSLMFKGAYMMRHSSVYYINDPEWRHYVQKAEIGAPAVARYTLVDK